MEMTDDMIDEFLQWLRNASDEELDSAIASVDKELEEAKCIAEMEFSMYVPHVDARTEVRGVSIESDRFNTQYGIVENLAA